MSHKYVYLFSEGNGKMRELLGGKGANLAEMTNLGMPVPQGFTITTEACTSRGQFSPRSGFQPERPQNHRLQAASRLSDRRMDFRRP